MPHVVVKLYPGRSEEKKQQLAERITKDVMEVAGCEKKAISVAIEEVDPAEWKVVYQKEIMAKQDTLYIKPGYKPEGL